VWAANSDVLERMREMFATWLNIIAVFAAGFAFGLWMPKGEKKPTEASYGCRTIMTRPSTIVIAVCAAAAKFADAPDLTK
jgi:hypothetical protein